MNVHSASCGHHFMMHVSHIITLYTLNLYSAICQLYLDKTGRKKKYKFHGTFVHCKHFYLILNSAQTNGITSEFQPNKIQQFPCHMHS